MPRQKIKNTRFTDFLANQTGSRAHLSAKMKRAPDSKPRKSVKSHKRVKSVFSQKEIESLAQIKTKNLGHVLDIFLADESTLKNSGRDVDRELLSNWNKKYTDKKNYIEKTMTAKHLGEGWQEKIIHTLNKPVSFYPLLHTLIEQTDQAKYETREKLATPWVLKLATTIAACLVLAVSIGRFMPLSSNMLIRLFDGLFLFPYTQAANFGYLDEISRLNIVEIDFSNIAGNYSPPSSQVKSDFIRNNQHELREHFEKESSYSIKNLRGRVAGAVEVNLLRQTVKPVLAAEKKNDFLAPKPGILSKLARKQIELSRQWSDRLTAWLGGW